MLQDFELRLRWCNDLVKGITLKTGINLMSVFKYAIVLCVGFSILNKLSLIETKAAEIYIIYLVLLSTECLNTCYPFSQSGKLALYITDLHLK